MYNWCMKFEWDRQKSLTNKTKHGIDFESGRDLWLDENRVEIHAPRPIENRFILIARYQQKLWSCVYTLRNDAIRIISVRRARKRESDLYAKENAGQNQ
jgi:uncharacterized DUF497 family protein